MAEALDHLLRENPVGLLFVILFFGYLIGKFKVRGFELGPVTGVLFSGLVFGLSLLLVRGFQDVAPMQFVEQGSWIPSWGISYHIGIDGLSLWLVVLATFLTPLALLGSWTSIGSRVREFVVFMLLLEAGMIGVFVALDLFLFYVFWEAMLIPMYFLIGVWGHERRIYAAVKFFLYTFAGSVVMLVAFLVLYRVAGVRTFDLAALVAVPVDPALQAWLFLACALAFAIKVPMFPFHTWLPDAHVEAPTAGSVILAMLPDTGERYLSTPLFEDIPEGPDEGQDLLDDLEY